MNKGTTDLNEVREFWRQSLDSMSYEELQQIASTFDIPIQQSANFGYQHPNLQESIYDKQKRDFNESIQSSAKYRCLAGFDERLPRIAQLSITSAMANGYVSGWYDMALAGVSQLDLYRRILKDDYQYGSEAASVTASALLDLAKKSNQSVKSSVQRDYEVARVARQRAEQFFRAPVGFLRNIKFDSSEEDKELFMTRLSTARLATWGNDKDIAYNWYNTVLKIADEDVPEDEDESLGF